MAATYQVIGKSLARVDGVEKVTGSARYTADVDLPGTLWGRTLKSPYPYARIVSIDTSAAKALPGVYAVLTGRDIADAGLWGRAVKDVPVIAVDIVRFVGERVAAVAAVDEDTADAAINLIDVVYEELGPMLTPEQSLAPDAAILHPDFNSYSGFPQKHEEPSNIHFRMHRERGDVEAGFAEADLLFENTYVTQRMHQGYLEPQAVLVNCDESDDRVHVWMCSKVPYNTRESLAVSGNLEEKKLLFHHTYIGGDFGGKGNSRNTPVAYYLAKVTGKPVRIVTDYVEEFGAGNPRHHTITHLKTGVKRDGTLVSHTVDYIVDSGAYAAFKPMGTISGANQAAGPYRIPNVRIDARFVYTNNIPGGFMRAPGEPQGVFAIESQLDEIARSLGIDPLEIRRKNLIVDGEETAWGEHLDAVKAVETLEAAVAASGYETSPKRPGVGRGIAVGDRGTPGGEGTSEVTLHPDGRVVVGTPIFDQGTGTYTTLLQVAAEEMGVSPDKVEIEIWNSDAVPMDAGVAGSRATRVNSIVCYEASQEAKRALVELATRQLGWAGDKTSFSDGELKNTELEESISWQDLLAQAGQTVSGRFHSEPRMAGPHLTNFVAQVAEVSVDPETGEVKVLNFTTAQETGRILNPMGHQGQVNGGFIQGIGYAMTEEVIVEDGRVTTLSFGDYKLPSIKDIPPLQTVNLTSETGFGPYNIRSIGEGPHIPVAAAIANAVQDATGARVRTLPVTSEKVWRALHGESV